MAGLVAYGAYLPHNRLRRAEIAGVLGSGAGRGTRAVASYDEDTTSMAVEAARYALAGLPDRSVVRQVFFATATPAYLDKTNATAIHAALDLDERALAVDMAGAVRSGVGALVTGAQAPVPTLSLLSDIRTGMPGGADERDGGDGAAAFVFGGVHGEDDDDPGPPVLADVVAHATTTSEFLDRWRLPGASSSRVWEERFGVEAYAPLADAALADALKDADLTPDQVDHLVVAGLHARAVRQAVKASGVPAQAVADDRVAQVGNSGTAQAGVLLADVLDRAQPGQNIVVTVLGDGVSVLVLRATEALAAHRQPRPVAAQVEAGDDSLSYATFLTWRGFLDREPPRRPDPAPPYAPPSRRREDWKFAFVASRCTQCGTRHLPPARVCRNCHVVDEMTREPLADVPATVVTYTVDRLAYSPSPPVLVVVVDFDGGGRFRCQLTDASEDGIAIGDRVEVTFRRLVTTHGVHNYFWKARPLRTRTGAGG
jgi:hydroxymethylglutaryl-CoA synthase